MKNILSGIHDNKGEEWLVNLHDKIHKIFNFLSQG